MKDEGAMRKMTRYAVVTGADRGLGLALTERLLASGYSVFAGRFDRAWDGLDRLAQAYPDGRLHIATLDVADDRSVEEAAGAVRERTDRLELLVNNAGILGDTEAKLGDAMDFAGMLHVMNTNSLGPLRVTNALIGLLMNGEGKMVVNISSEAGSIGDCWRTSWYGYAMSKAALNMQSSLVHNTVKEAGGRVLALHPGWMKTHMRGVLEKDADFTPEQQAEAILRLIHDRMRSAPDRYPFGLVDYAGRPMPW